MPPPAAPVLPETVVLVAVRAPVLSIAPPLVTAELPVNVPPVKFAAVAMKRAPPEGAVLVVKVVSVTESGEPMKL